MARTLLLTGAAGFIGGHLTRRLLDAGHRVVGLDNFCDFYDPELKRENWRRAAKFGGASLLEADLRDDAAVRGAVSDVRPDAVLHMAAMAGVRPSIADPSTYSAVNVTGTAHVLEAAARHGGVPVLFASSSSVYGNNEKTPFAETDPVTAPISPYAATKRAGELLCHTYWHLYGLPSYCLRFFTVYGPAQRPDLAIRRFMERIAAGEPIDLYGDGASSRDYTYVDDIVSGVERALDRLLEDGGHRFYNLGGDEPVTLADLVATIERVTGRAAERRHQPARPGDVNRTWADLTRSRAELGYAPRTSLEEGLRRQWAWMRGEDVG